MKAKIFITALVSSFLFLTSCSKDEDANTIELTQDDVTTSAKIDAGVDDVSSVVLDEFSGEVGISAKNILNKTPIALLWKLLGWTAKFLLVQNKSMVDVLTSVIGAFIVW